MSPVGLGAGGAVGIAFESVMGTYVAPAAWIPVRNESLHYTEPDRYYSDAIQQQTMTSDVKHAGYHVEGDIVLESDTQFLPYLLHTGRVTVVKTGTGPYTYVYKPSSGASSGIGAGAATPKTASITVIRNAIPFKYVGCVLGGWNVTIDNGVSVFTANILGLGEVSDTDATAVGTPSWPAARSLFGMDAHTVSTGASGATPTYTANPNFNGFTFTINDNATAQNRILTSRQATYIAYGMTEGTIETQLDFLDRTDYDSFKNLVTAAIKLASSNGAGDSFTVEGLRGVFDTYDVGLGAAADLIMAGVNYRLMNQAGATGYKATVVTPTLNIS